MEIIIKKKTTTKCLADYHKNNMLKYLQCENLLKTGAPCII